MKLSGRFFAIGALSFALAIGAFISPASAHTALASSCYGSSCDLVNPLSTDCPNNDVIVDEVWGGDMSPALLYSYNCVSNWTVGWFNIAADMHWFGIRSQSPAQNDNYNECTGSNNPCYSLMVDGRYAAQSWGENLQTGVYLETGWH
jgi:hypothetical protein